MKINPQDMLAGEERQAFWHILRDNIVFVFCLKKQLHFYFFVFIFGQKHFHFVNNVWGSFCQLSQIFWHAFKS
jgi:hypothetical protein